MTLSPSEDRNIKGIDGPKYELNQVCAVPGCGQGKPLERHHLWRKSDVIGDKWWVEVGDKLVGNCINLCHFHHTNLTDNICKVKFDGFSFTWSDPTIGVMDLLWQPPIQVVGGIELAMKETTGIDRYHEHGDVPPGEVCPSCHRKVPVKKEKDPEEKKVRKTWCVAVPEDRWEDGADVLGTLLEEARREMGKAGLPYGEADTVKYHVLATALALFVQNAVQMLSDS